MRICFCSLDPYWHGLQNNGGSRTILKSVETLNKMGHKAYVVTKTDRFDWFKHDKPLKKIPKNADVCIAVAISDIKPMCKKAPKKAKLGYWARPFESWQMSKEKIIRRLIKFWSNGGIIMVNSSWQKEWIKNKCKIDSTVVYNGLDFDAWEDSDRNDDDDFTIGFLYHKNPLKRWKDCKKLMAMLGNDYVFKVLGKDKFITGRKLIKFYQQCDIWFVPCKREGLHNVPMEANLCGSLIVCSDSPANGCMDYCNRDTAHTYSTLEEAVEMIERPDFTKVGRMQKLLQEKIGSREQNMRRLLEIFE